MFPLELYIHYLKQSKFQTSESIFTLITSTLLFVINTFMPAIHETRIQSNGLSPYLGNSLQDQE